MDGDSRRARLSSFVVGGLVGASATIAAARRRRARNRSGARVPQGLEAFERAPCFREIVEADEQDRPH